MEKMLKKFTKYNKVSNSANDTLINFYRCLSRSLIGTDRSLSVSISDRSKVLLYFLKYFSSFGYIWKCQLKDFMIDIHVMFMIFMILLHVMDCGILLNDH